MKTVESFLTESQVALLLNVTPRTLQNWRRLRKGPPFLKINSKTIRYDADSLRTWSDNFAAEGEDPNCIRDE